MIKFKMLLASILLALTGLAVMPQAAVEAASTPQACVNKAGAGVITCAYVDHFRQYDGTGVFVQAYVISTNQGCSSLERDGGGRYSDIQWRISDDDTGIIVASGNTSPMQACAEARWPSGAVGPDTGAIDFTLSAKVRINWAQDHIAYWVWRLYPSGNSVLRASGTYAA